MDTRRDFIKKAALLSGAAGMAAVLPASVLKAMAINPAPGSTYLDAEHIVILMQENRSFDHCYGTLQGVRGYNDPRAILKPDNNLVWLQQNAAGETYAPFRLNIKETNATWLGSLPHSWSNQVDARNGGKYDKWLLAKPSGHKGFANVPLTMGYYNREDLPFYYALADAFTVCDQNFCSSLTGTTPNRLYLWTGTVRPEKSIHSFAHLRNEDLDFFLPASWTTFPERLEENGISWKIYQNEISLPSGFNGDEDAWLSNFTDNPIEFFSQYRVQHADSYRAFMKKAIDEYPAQIAGMEQSLSSMTPGTKDYLHLKDQISEKKTWLTRAQEGIHVYTAENFNQLSQKEKNLHQKAFSINKNDPHYRQLDSLQYMDGTVQREMKIPKGDVLHQFRQDVNSGELPTVSWIVGPENFSDHPGAPWYGAWYVAEAMDILTKKPEVWKKTIFILCYDENDGYFDHVPPFVAPDPNDKNTGAVSAGMDAATEFVTLEQDMTKYDKTHSRQNAIGLGYRVPLVIASPWSRGGKVCSQVFDHTSIIQFVEKFIHQKFNTKIEETNITGWRRSVCGDLSAVFTPYTGEKMPDLFPEKKQFIETMYNAKFKKDPSGYRVLSEAEIGDINKRKSGNALPQQEKGIRPACALPYQLYADGQLSADKQAFTIHLKASNEIFGGRAAGSPFYMYAGAGDNLTIRSYAVAAGALLEDSFDLQDLNGGPYEFRLYGPNGFFRHFRGNAKDRVLPISVEYDRMAADRKKLTGHISVVIDSGAAEPGIINITDNAYRGQPHTVQLVANAKNKIISLPLDLTKSHGWYDFTVRLAGNAVFEKRYAGHVETGRPSFTDPLMGGMV